jgi:signal transduction histidine kinase
MTIRLRFTLLLGLLLGGLLLALLGLRYLERAERDEILAADRQARAQLLNHWIDAAHRELGQFASELAQAEAFASGLAQSRPEVARSMVRASVAGERIVALWIVQADGSVAFETGVQQAVAPFALPVDAADLAQLLSETPSPRFFADAGGTLLEVMARPLPGAPARNWLLLARPWDDAQLRALSALTESTLTLRPAHELARTPESPSRLVLVRPLPDARGRPLRMLHVEYELPEVERSLRADVRQMQVFVLFGGLVLAAMAMSLRSWVLSPLRNIGDSLARNDRAPVEPLSGEKTEFGQVAQLVISSFERRAELQREIGERARAQEALAQSEAALRDKIAERARLGRDLHDGVIQSLYAAGMGLAGIRTQLSPEQTEAAARLEQTRGALNETIHDLRNFIIGLEPESLKLQSFSDAVSALLESMAGMRSFRTTVDLDDKLANRLSLSQRVHALQIAREAVSNALRHGAANHIEIALRQRGDLAEFKVVDDGSGFDATASTSPGNGLLNFAQRARELDAELTVDSQPGRGTLVTLVFSLP